MNAVSIGSIERAHLERTMHGRMAVSCFAVDDAYIYFEAQWNSEAR
jgi:hypothetical protein